MADCEICTLDLQGEDLHKTKCCGKTYHRECIRNWYVNIETKMKYIHTVPSRQCPNCRNDAGYLDYRDGEKWYMYIYPASTKPVMNTTVDKCKSKTLRGTRCKKNAVKNGLCNLHSAY